MRIYSYEQLVLCLSSYQFVRMSCQCSYEFVLLVSCLFSHGLCVYCQISPSTVELCTASSSGSKGWFCSEHGEHTENELFAANLLCFDTGIAQFQSCHDSTGCGGNELTGVSTPRDCCLGSGLSFQDSGTCRQCIGKPLTARKFFTRIIFNVKISRSMVYTYKISIGP